MSEIWKTIDCCCDYEVSSLGRIRRGERLLKPAIRSRYLHVTLCGGGYRLNRSVHELVATAFCGMMHPGEVNHKDGNKLNNCAENLEWVSRRDNLIHSYDIGLRNRGKDSHLCRKLSESNVREILSLKGQKPQSEIAKLFNISQTYVGKIHRGLKWRHITQ